MIFIMDISATRSTVYQIRRLRSPTQLDEDVEQQVDCTSIWEGIPDSILLHIFSFLDVPHLGQVVQTCKAWNRVGGDESLWRNLLYTLLKVSPCPLADGKLSWRQEVKRITHHAPTVLSETLTQHTDEVLHVSFSHNGKLFSTTSKDATLKVWEVGYPTTQKYSKDFHELLEWDFTQFSCFNESDTMILVSSVKTSPYMDRRGYMAILSLLHDFAILRVVTMDPSQLFGAWLDDRTFLGGSLEISLDRFATTVQIEAFEIPDIHSAVPVSPGTPTVEQSAGEPLFTFSSESASLIKFLTVATPAVTSISQKCVGPGHRHIGKDIGQQICQSSESVTAARHQKCSTSCKQEVEMGTSHNESEATEPCSELSSEKLNKLCGESRSGCSNINEHACSAMDTDESECSCNSNGNSDRDESGSIGMKKCKKLKDNCDIRMQSIKNLQNAKVHRPTSLGGDSDFSSRGKGATNNSAAMEGNVSDLPCQHTFQNQAPSQARAQYPRKANSFSSSKKHFSADEVVKNLIFVTGEFAVALHQLGFKNVSAYAKESVLARGVTPMDEDNPEGFMVVNYSNNDVHIVHREQRTDKPDNLIDLFGHVTGQCLSADHRYLFINCRPWIGSIDRTDPWATPDLSPNIEVRVIDLSTMQELGVRFKGHKGFSPSNMCCFVFLDVSEDYVSSGSEDNKGYLWDRHYQSMLATFPHDTGVVNAVAFNPKDQEFLVTVSDDFIVKVWRSPCRMETLKALTAELLD